MRIAEFIPRLPSNPIRHPVETFRWNVSTPSGKRAIDRHHKVDTGSGSCYLFAIAVSQIVTTRTTVSRAIQQRG